MELSLIIIIITTISNLCINFYTQKRVHVVDGQWRLIIIKILQLKFQLLIYKFFRKNEPILFEFIILLTYSISKCSNISHFCLDCSINYLCIFSKLFSIIISFDILSFISTNISLLSLSSNNSVILLFNILIL